MHLHEPTLPFRVGGGGLSGSPDRVVNALVMLRRSHNSLLCSGGSHISKYLTGILFMRVLLLDE